VFADDLTVPHALIKALVRDDYKCVVTGAYDIRGRNIPRILKELRKGGGTSTQCAHIVPDSTYFNVSTPGDPSDKVCL
jgi:hypothetical protein